jgi:hypothetical protein
MTEATGSCHCGQVTYGVAGPVVQVVACHCGLCRGMTGAAFSAYVVVQTEHFRLTRGRDALAGYAVSERTTRHFCSHCGTPIYNANPATYKGLTMLYLGTLAGHERLAPRINLFCESKLAWVKASEASKSFERAPVGAG